MKTTNLQLPRRWFDLPVPATIMICVFGLLVIAALFGRIHTGAGVAAEPTPQLPIIIVASPLPNGPPPTAVPAAQVAAVLPNGLRRAVVAYDSPNGSVIGAIEQGRAYTVLARFGADWLQADVTGSGVVWLKADQVLDLPAGLADLQPTEAPSVIYQVVNQPVEAVSTPAAAVPVVEPAPVVWATSGPIRKEDFREPDRAASCAFTGCL